MQCIGLPVSSFSIKAESGSILLIYPFIYAFVYQHTHSLKLRKQTVRECDLVNISKYSRPKKGTSPKVSSFTEVKQNINTLPSFQDIVEELVRYNLDLFADCLDTDNVNSQ